VVPRRRRRLERVGTRIQTTGTRALGDHDDRAVEGRCRRTARDRAKAVAAAAAEVAASSYGTHATKTAHGNPVRPNALALPRKLRPEKLSAPTLRAPGKCLPWLIRPRPSCRRR